MLKNKPYQQEVSFSIKKSFGSRKGWKIMPDDGHHDIDASALQSVVSIIKDMEVKVDDKFEFFTKKLMTRKIMKKSYYFWIRNCLFFKTNSISKYDFLS